MLDEPAETVDADDSTDHPTQLTDLPGVGSTRATALSEAGYERVDEIVAASLFTLTRSTELGERTCRCIWAVANEACESEGTLLANLADGLDVPRSEVASAYGDLAPIGVPPEEAVGSLIEWFTPSRLAEALQDGGYSIRYYHMLSEEGFETPSDVTDASVDALTAAQYVGDRVAPSLRAAVEDWTESDETAIQGQDLATEETGETQTTDPDDETVEDSEQYGESTNHTDLETPATDSTGHSGDEPTAQQAQSDGTDQVPKARAQELLERSIGPDAEFRPQQWEAIDRLVNDNDRLLLVQRTGWGKSTVYFTATKLRREQGAGPTLIVSPLLSLMHNQVQDAENQLGLSAWTINSNNTDDWDEAKTAVVEGECDVLLISPERLANSQFQEEILLEMDEEFGLLVVDEAHCISDWGHDFRPDYRRIRRILNELPAHIPVAATTATANDRVVDDITTQVPDLDAIRRELVRDSLRIQTIERRLQIGYETVVSEQLDALNRRIENAVVGLERAAETRQARIQRAADLEQRIDTAYTTLTASRLDAVDDRIETALQEIEHAAETEAVTVRAARGRIGGLETRIDRAYETHITQETEALERRIESAYRDIETDTDVQEAKQEARQLRIVILVLVGLLLLGVALWAGGIL